VNSLKSLGKVHQFQIIFYNEEPHIFNTRAGQSPGLYFADDASKASAMAFVDKITGDGGTRHLEALLTALSLSPDVIFFLTDANDPRLTEPELQKIRDRNRRGVVIHCIEFGAGPSQDDNNFLQRLANQNRGSRVYVDVTKLQPLK
jgi:Ca-activated chloride channel family protein